MRHLIVAMLVTGCSGMVEMQPVLAGTGGGMTSGAGGGMTGGAGGGMTSGTGGGMTSGAGGGGSTGGGASGAGGGTVTSTNLTALAASMAPSSWAALNTTNINPTLVATGADGNHLGYTDDITYDPTSKKFFYLGGDHADTSIFATFDSMTNAWQRIARAPWMPPLSAYLNGMMHSYDHSAIDTGRGVFYHRGFGQHAVHRYDIATSTWDSPAIPSRPTGGSWGDYDNCCDAFEWFPELNGLVWVAGDGIAGQSNAHVYLFSETTKQWSVLSGNVDLAGTWHSAEYNPVHHVLIFYSASTNKLYKLDQNETVTQIATPPFTWYSGSSYVSVLTVDQTSGKYLVLTSESRQLYTYDVPTNTWAAKASTGLPNLSSKPVVATPVHGLGVNFFTACKVNGGCQSYLYKP